MATTARKKTNGTETRRIELISVEFGRKLKEFRIAADRSQEELAFAAEMDRTYISLLERGLANPSLWTLGTLAHTLGINVADLLRGNTHTVLPSSAPGGAKRRVNQASHDGAPVGTRRSKLR